ncbi:quinate repressor [Ophiostoma piceae UAMH 11346]|uniref:Quinate repressor n=1 Tax=Ophiostoma piceae (strain UAMH 11346) TaxID=1262450 RepID=S3C8D0_OPHP1|nr:quinate repressor [Ophiostoma piceae UAMH 11346]
MAFSFPGGVKRTFDAASADWNRPDGQRAGSGQFGQGINGRSVSISYGEPGSKPRRSTEETIYSFTRGGSVSYPPAPSGQPQFEPDASVILIGLRGAGKSTLAVIASTALRRKIVEADMVFQEIYGMSSSAYQREHGVTAYRKTQVDVLQHILDKYSHNAVIVCSWMEREVQARLSQCSSFPVVLVLRDTAAIQTHLRGWGEERVRGLVTAIVPVFRRCARFEIFNISEIPAQVPPPTAAFQAGTSNEPLLDSRSPAPHLTLKRAERHFLKFLSLILPKGTLPFFESAFPLASSLTEDRKFTYALTIQLSDYANGDVDVEGIEAGADAIEIVADCQGDDSIQLTPTEADNISRIVGLIRRSTVIPIIFHAILPNADNPTPAQRTAYISRVLHGLRLAPDYVTVDLRLPDYDVGRIKSASWTTRLIGHVSKDTHAAPAWHESIWMSYYHRAVDSGCHLARLTRLAASLQDNFDVSEFISNTKTVGPGPRLPLIAYNTGPKGRFSACFNPILTSVAPESPAAPDKSPSPDCYGQTTPPIRAPSTPAPASTPCLTALEATRSLYASFVYEPLQLYVIGAKVDYSISPAMHSVALVACGIPHTYRPHSTNSVDRVRALIHDPKFGGASIGLPFKVEAIRLSNSLSSHARAVGAVNTLIPVRQLNPDGSVPDYNELLISRNQSGPVKAIYGENTDWIGVRACIRRGLSPANAVRKSSVGLVIGAGGMARAAVYAMLQLGVKQIVVFNRTYENAEKMVSHFTGMLDRNEMQLLSDEPDIKPRFRILRTRQDSWPDNYRLPTMIISCIPTHSIGTNPSPDFTVPSQWLGSPTGGVVVELAYKTLSTPLLDQSKKYAHKGWVSLDGLDLLPEQGFAQFELFTGRRAPRRLMRQEVFKAHKDDEGRSNLPQLQTRLDWIVNQEP